MAFEALYGGAAGGGKSEALLMDPTRYVGNPNYRALLLRRTYPELRRSLIERSEGLYSGMGGTYNVTDHVWTFPGSDGGPGGKIEFGALERESDLLKYQSAEYQYIGFDELTTFTRKMYVFLISRLRSSDPTLPLRIRGATNPGGPGHDWVLQRFAPWLYPEGHRDYKGPRAEPQQRMWFKSRATDDGDVRDVWCSPDDRKARARVFFPANVSDNPYLAGSDYEDNLALLDPVTRRRLKDGDWMVKPARGLYFKRKWIPIVDRAPSAVDARVRYWDRASSTDEEADRTAGVKLSVTRNGLWFVEHVEAFRGRPYQVQQQIKRTARADLAQHGQGDPFENPGGVALFLEKDPGQAGASEVETLISELAEFAPRFPPPAGNKITRAQGPSAQCEQGMIFVVRGDWNDLFLDELEDFPDGNHDDQVDSLSGAFRQALHLAILARDAGDQTETVVSIDDDLEGVVELSDDRKAEVQRNLEAWGVTGEA